MMRIGLISNPRSQRNKRRMPAMREVAAGQRDLLHVEIDDMHAIAGVLSEFARHEVGLLVVSGGDGTVQKVLTDLLNGDDFGLPPSIAVLPSGMTNLIAADVGLSGDPAQSLARICRVLANGQAGETLERPVLSLWRTPTESPIHGMFLGTAAFYHGIMLARRKVHPLGAKHRLAAALAIGLGLFRLVTGWGAADTLRRAERMTIALDQPSAAPRDYLLFMATTLERLFLGLMPFWGEGQGCLRYTTVDHPPRRLWRALLPAVCGRPRSWMAAYGYHSGRAGECRLSLSCPLIFDGEVITPQPATPVVLRGDRHVAFWRC